MGVKRFDCGNNGYAYCQGCEEMQRDDEYGDYVEYSDYATLEAQLAGWKARESQQANHRIELEAQLAALEAETDRLCEAAKAYRIAVHVWALMECAESAAPAMTEASAKLTEVMDKAKELSGE